MSSATWRIESGGPSIAADAPLGGPANPSANGVADPPGMLAVELAHTLRFKARKIRVSAARLCAASVSADACLSLVCAIRIGTCF